MKKYLIVVFVLVLMSALAIGAKPDLTPTVATVNPSQGHAVVVIPKHAVEVAPGVFSLGTAEVDGETVEGYMFVDYRKEFSQQGLKAAKGTTCYRFLSSGAKWKVSEPWVVNPANTRGLGETFVFENLGFSISKWEAAAAKDVLGSGSSTTETLAADTSSPDSVNEVYFGDIAEPGSIAVTIVWGVFGGPPSQRKLVEWDQVYDQVDFDWSAAGEAGKMDFENINTHELGHSVGMGHPSDSCTEETMYRFAAFGETKKRDLNAGDIAGVKKMYG